MQESVQQGDIQRDWQTDLRDNTATTKLHMKKQKTPIRKSVQQADIQTHTDPRETEK